MPISPEHVDMLGQPLVEGCYVASAHGNSLRICRVLKLTPKMILVSDVNSGYWDRRVYPLDTIRLENEDILMHILKNSGR
jgi:hypothetical protein